MASLAGLKGVALIKTGLTIKDNSAKVYEALEAITKKRVYVGIPEDRNSRSDSSAFGNAAIGYLNEFGSPAQNIPARPHLVPGVQAVEARVSKMFYKGGQAALGGDIDAAEKALIAAGQVAADSVRKTIIDVIPPPLQKSTLAARRRRGHKGTTPLLETGEYKNNITFVVREVDDA